MLKRIAAYDYSPSMLTLFYRIFSRAGFEVIPSNSPMTCDEVEQSQPDLIILGYMVGYLDNELDILLQLRQNLYTASIPVIVCTTGAVHLQTREEIINDNLVVVVSKPFAVQQLLEAVNVLLKDERKFASV